jgi:hypothetical protein
MDNQITVRNTNQHLTKDTNNGKTNNQVIKDPNDWLSLLSVESSEQFSSIHESY